MSSIILTETKGRVAIITLNRPKVLNAINDEMMDEITSKLIEFDSNPDIGAIIISGSKKVFAAGVDIKAMLNLTYSEVKNDNFITKNWDIFPKIRKPIIASVSGYAIGGGCELALLCDIVFASTSAVFSQAEIKVGTIPGAGGTQRLTKTIGKSKTMYYCLTGKNISAKDALQYGIVSEIFPVDSLLISVINIATEISSKSNILNQMIKQSVNYALDSNLTQGIMFERNLFHSTFATEDRKEGMNAYIEKRKPIFKHK